MIMGVRLQGFNVIIIILSVIALAYVAYPLVTVMVFVEPSMLLHAIFRPQLTNAFILSVFSATASTLLLCIFGILADRFHLRSKVVKITKYDEAIVDVYMVADRFHLTSRITEEARADLQIRQGDDVFAMFKASSPQVVREEEIEEE
jgi:molybdopterin-binding protein